MSGQGWDRKVYRLRKLPHYAPNKAAAGDLVSQALGISPEDVCIWSLAKTSDIWESPPSRVATLQFKTAPTAGLEENASPDEWLLPLPRGSGEAMILDTHFAGMTVLADVEPADHNADCIAISGLASHPFGSWQPRGKDKTYMWVRDEIPRSVPGVRTVVYGYDSKLAGSKSFQSIGDIASNLILHLRSGGWNSPASKPIVFLAHSLGGIVLKDAIVQVADRDKSIAAILDNVVGAIMFGVPSLGMEQSHLMAMVEGQANELLLQDLSRENGSNYLRQLNKRFDGLSFVRTARILWAYETEESPTVIELPDGRWDRNGPPAVLVNPDSATCHNHRKNKSLAIPINRDHSGMVKFSRGDPSLGPILVSLAELCSTRQAATGLPSAPTQKRKLDDQEPLPSSSHHVPPAERTMSQEQDTMLRDLCELLLSLEAIHKDLDSPELNFRIDQIEDPFRNTFKWIFDQPAFSSWLQDESELFWINGKPGSGKSTLMKFIFRSRETWELLHNWRETCHEVRAGFFFHYRGVALQKSFEGILRSLIIQILAPQWKAFRTQHHSTWQRYDSLKQDQRRREMRKTHLEGCLRIIREAEAGPDALKSLAQILTKQSNHILELHGIDSDGELAQRRRAFSEEATEMEAQLRYIDTQLVSMANQCAPSWGASSTQFLAAVVREYHEGAEGRIHKLEKILHRLVDQDFIDMKLVLFLDALDEFDGNLNLISRFLKGLVKKSPTSLTRVKVCFSSRPWEPLKNHFSTYPSISLQNHTKYDIESYAVGSLANSQNENPNILRLVPFIIVRANGVFLWVRLALKELLDVASRSPADASPAFLEKKLQELPVDLYDFYELIIERISKPNRRRTFALLELLIRLGSTTSSATEIRDAVRCSEYATFQDFRDEIESAYPKCHTADYIQKQVRNDIATWGGGLVEIKVRDGIERPGLMHQTVLEFTLGLSFKRIVLGDLATILNENGHSFHMRYAISSRHRDPQGSEDRLAALPGLREAAKATHRDNERLAYHAQQSELTTGHSQIEFLDTVPADQLRLFTRTAVTNKDPTAVFLCFVASYGLTLTLRDWIERNPGELERISRKPAPLPLLSSLIFAPAGGVFQEGYLTMAQLLLDSGFNLERDPDFYPALVEEVWKAEFRGSVLPKATVHKLVGMVLTHGQNPDATTAIFSVSNLGSCMALHIAPPSLAAELLRHGADVNAEDSQGRTPLDWMMEFPLEVKLMKHSAWNTAWRFEMARLLVEAGGNIAEATQEAVKTTLADFERQGYDTAPLHAHFRLSSETWTNSLWKMIGLGSGAS